MVNLNMRVGGEETATMSRSFLMKKYSNCPLKKRPVQYVKEEFCDTNSLSDDNSEPENLSTKPEDLSRKTFTPPPAIALISVKKERELIDEKFAFDGSSTERVNGVAFSHCMSKSNGPLLPLKLNTSANKSDTITYVTRPRAVPAQYPPQYVPINYIYPPPDPSDVLPYYYPSPISPLTPPRITREPPFFSYSYEQSCSPPRHAFTPFRSNVPVIAAAALPSQCPVESRLYRGDHLPLSPTSTCSSNSYPYYRDRSPAPISPEDLSSPSSVSSNSGDSCSSTKKNSKVYSSGSVAVAPRFKCQYCSKSYSTFSGLSKHQQFHCTANGDVAVKKKFKCKYCDKEYNSLGALKMHIRTHTLPCKCKLCGKAFSRPWLLQGHIRTHTGEKPFSCPHCNRAFADRSNLRAHLQTHSDVKKYSCPTCSKTFSRMSLLSKHTDGGCPGLASSTDVVRVTGDIIGDMKAYYS